jgi:hypothetical protein
MFSAVHHAAHCLYPFLTLTQLQFTSRKAMARALAAERYPDPLDRLPPLLMAPCSPALLDLVNLAARLEAMQQDQAAEGDAARGDLPP